MKSTSFATVMLIAIFILPCNIHAQDLEPRAYSPSPVGTSFLVVGFGRSSGGVVTDPTIPITDVHATVYTPFTGVGHTFGLFGRQTLVTAALPYAWGKVTGEVGEEEGEVTRSGLADTSLKFAINLHGSPAQSFAEFARTPHKSFILASSLSISAPSGQYDGTKLINLGTNRWAIKPEIGFSYPAKKFYFDVYLAAASFTENTQFYPGQSIRKQDILASVQGHVSYTVRRGMWMAFDSTWFGGGAVHINGGPATGRLDNSRIGATMSAPIGKWQSVKASYSSGVSERVGTNFRTVSVGWQYVWPH